MPSFGVLGLNGLENEFEQTTKRNVLPGDRRQIYFLGVFVLVKFFERAPGVPIPPVTKSHQEEVAPQRYYVYSTRTVMENQLFLHMGMCSQRLEVLKLGGRMRVRVWLGFTLGLG